MLEERKAQLYEELKEVLAQASTIDGAMMELDRLLAVLDENSAHLAATAQAPKLSVVTAAMEALREKKENEAKEITSEVSL